MKLSVVIIILPLAFLLIQPVLNTQQSIDQMRQNEMPQKKSEANQK